MVIACPLRCELKSIQIAIRNGTTDNSKIASYMAKDVLVTWHGAKILEDSDRQKEQTRTT